MKTLPGFRFFICLIFSFLTLRAIAGVGDWNWTWLDPKPTGAALYDVACNGSNCVAVGEKGIILMSSDGGVNWSVTYSPVSTDLQGVIPWAIWLQRSVEFNKSHYCNRNFHLAIRWLFASAFCNREYGLSNWFLWGNKVFYEWIKLDVVWHISPCGRSCIPVRRHADFVFELWNCCEHPI